MSSRGFNKVFLMGNLTADPELRYTPQGTALCSFTVATNRTWTDQAGQQQESVEFTRCVAWAKRAEICSQLLFKGRKTFVEGRLQTREWEGQDKQKRRTTEVVVDNMIALGLGKGREDTGVSTETNENVGPATHDVPATHQDEAVPSEDIPF